MSSPAHLAPSNVHHQRSVRAHPLPGTTDLFFVTLSTAGRRPFFGDLDASEMRLSTAGEIAREEWLWTPIVGDAVTPDAFVVLPNQMHLLVRTGSEHLVDVLEGYKATVEQRIAAVLGRGAGPLWADGFRARPLGSEREVELVRRAFAETPVRSEALAFAA